MRCFHFKTLSLVFLTLFEILGSYTYNYKKTLQIYNFLLGKDQHIYNKIFLSNMLEKPKYYFLNNKKIEL